MTLEAEDRELFDKLNTLMQHGLNEASALNFFSLLTVAEYDRLIALCEQGAFGLSDQVCGKLVTILQKLREVKARVSHVQHT